VLAKGKTGTGRMWVYVRDDAPFGGPAPPAALFHYSRDRRGTHPRAHLATWVGILQADAYDGYGELDLAKAINYMLRRWPPFTGFLEDGRVCIASNAAERALHGVTVDFH
jgi:Transposase IS66 family